MESKIDHYVPEKLRQKGKLTRSSYDPEVCHNFNHIAIEGKNFSLESNLQLSSKNKVVFNDITENKKGRYTCTSKPYNGCIPVKNSHFFSYIVIYTDISVASGIFIYPLYTKKSRITFHIPKQFYIPIKYLATDIFKIRSDISGHFEKIIPIYYYSLVYAYQKVS